LGIVWGLLLYASGLWPFYQQVCYYNWRFEPVLTSHHNSFNHVILPCAAGLDILGCILLLFQQLELGSCYGLFVLLNALAAVSGIWGVVCCSEGLVSKCILLWNHYIDLLAFGLELIAYIDVWFFSTVSRVVLYFLCLIEFIMLGVISINCLCLTFSWKNEQTEVWKGKVSKALSHRNWVGCVTFKWCM
jgi:hypothetical protein